MLVSAAAIYACLLGGSAAREELRGAQRPFAAHVAPAVEPVTSGGSVLRLEASSSAQLAVIYNATQAFDLDVWSVGRTSIDVRVNDEEQTRLFDSLESAVKDNFRYLVEDVDQAIERTTPQKSEAQSTLAALIAATKGATSRTNLPTLDETFFSDFQTVEAINAWMVLMTTLYPKTTRIVNLGKSHEGRDVQGLQIFQERSLYERLRGKKRKTIVINGALHAREWISVSTVCYVAYSLIVGKAVGPAIGSLLSQFDFVFFPTVNVDGYAYTWTDRLWRKNRQATSVSYCRGIDLDRNWAFGWTEGGAIGSRSNPCSENYQGANPFDADETRLLSGYINEMQDSSDRALTGYLDLHSYAQTILYPYALSCDVEPRDEETLLELAIGGSKAIKAVTGEYYDAESACNADGHLSLPMSSGNAGAALDWVYHRDVHWAYVLKLRDTGSYGFLVPKEEIVPTGREIVAFVQYFANFILERGH